MRRIAIIVLALAGFFCQAQGNATEQKHVQSVTAISRVLGDGRKVETVVLEYDAPAIKACLPAATGWKARR
ncbi:hypothetical protein [Phocaeicola sp.]|uniref:hypothetical protein n=1 Tax=Phocaeicola sp. TaxID=2773926 RepID=UPI0023C92414|nr:hypothetical protein [Phocaeicola sp.]MDE5677084.1 hypothetical protein [Phocaeicola sp.]